MIFYAKELSYEGLARKLVHAMNSNVYSIYLGD